MVIASNFQYIHQFSRSAHVPNYNCIKHRLLPYCKLFEHPSYTVDLWIFMFDDACHSLDRNVFMPFDWNKERLNQSSPFFHLCKSKSMTYLETEYLERLNQSSPFFHLCKSKSMTYLETDVIIIFFYSLGIYLSHFKNGRWCYLSVCYRLPFLFVAIGIGEAYSKACVLSVSHISF